ncbi:MAG TPA: STAS domain-containing protein [Nitrospirota bacterium]|nr:STAS domain-containing protein [Nitrospirota bacterium]
MSILGSAQEGEQKAVIKFSLSSKSEMDVAVMMPRGYLTDIGARQIEKSSEEFLDRGFKKLVINFSSVELINTHGISIFTSILQKASEIGCRVCFTNINKLHREIFELTGLLTRVDVFQDEDDAMICLKKTA